LAVRGFCWRRATLEGLDGPINRDAFETYVVKVLIPELRQGDIVVMDNLSSHKGPRVRQKPAPSCAICRPTAQTSIPSRTPSPSSRRCSECQTARNIAPRSASNLDPLMG